MWNTFDTRSYKALRPGRVRRTRSRPQLLGVNRIDIVTKFREDRDEAVRQVLVQFDLHRLTGVSPNGRSSWADAAAKTMAA